LHLDPERDTIVEDAMRAFLIAILLTLGGALAIPAVTDLVGGKPARSAVPAKNHRFGNDRPVENMSIGKPSWRSAAGLLVVDMTVHNANQYSVENLIIACDFLDDRGHPVGTRGTALRRIFAVGKRRQQARSRRARLLVRVRRGRRGRMAISVLDRRPGGTRLQARSARPRARARTISRLSLPGARGRGLSLARRLVPAACVP